MRTMPLGHPVSLIRSHIDEPESGSTHHGHGFEVTGWIEPPADFVSVEVRTGDDLLGASAILHRRPDVTEHLQIPDAPSGFRVPCTAQRAHLVDGQLELHVRVLRRDGTVTPLGEVSIHLAGTDYAARPYGALLVPSFDHMLHRNDIYCVGSPAEEPSLECLKLLLQYLNEGERVIDVGCGVGAYARALRERGIEWHGCEADAAQCATMTEHDLPNTLVAGNTLPFADASFDAAMSIEVLEHVSDPDAFVAEIARVTKQRAVFSVPNAEAIPLLAPMLAVPWHMLESSHINFFNRFNLGQLLRRHFLHVDVFGYGKMPLRTVDDLSIDYHLMAVAIK